MEYAQIEDVKREVAEAQKKLEQAQKKLASMQIKRLGLNSEQIAALMKAHGLVRRYEDGSITDTPPASTHSDRCWPVKKAQALKLSDIKSLVAERPDREYTAGRLNEKLFRSKGYVRVWDDGEVYADEAMGSYRVQLDSSGRLRVVKSDGSRYGHAMRVYRKVVKDGKCTGLAEMSYDDLAAALG